MKQLIYGIFMAIPALLLASCSGTEDYDAYIETLKAQPAAIDTITTPAGYTSYLDSLAIKANNFQQLGVKLNADQQEQLSALSMEIQKALDAKYASLSATVAACDTLGDTTTLDASAPVAPAYDSSDVVKLQ